VELERKEIQPGIVALEIKGEVRTSADRGRLAQVVDDEIANHQRRIILDLSQMNLIDSAGVGTIVLCFSRLRKSGGELRISGPKGMVETVLKLTQIHRAIRVFPSVAEAASDFPVPGDSPAPHS
jgi:anti-anti-sigma factor